jgi:hypothetical protein
MYYWDVSHLSSFSYMFLNCALLWFAYKPKHVAHSTKYVKICCDCPFIHLVTYASPDGKISQTISEKFSQNNYVFTCKLKAHSEVGCRFRDSGVDRSVKNLDHNRKV